MSDSGGTARQSPEKDLHFGSELLRGTGAMIAAKRKAHGLLEQKASLAERIRGGAAGSMWSRLNAVDFINSSIQFAGLGVLTLFPFLIMVSAGTGHDLRRTLITLMGLDQHASKDLDTLISPGYHAITSLSLFGAVLIVLGAIGIASTLQTWYQRVYEQPPANSWTRQIVNRSLWLAGFIVYLAFQEFVDAQLAGTAKRIPFYIVTLVVAIVFYTWTQRVLLLSRVGWKELLPGGVATAVSITGLGVFSELLFSRQIVSSDNDYGPIGVVIVLLSYLVGVGVCFHLGAVLGRMWNERRFNNAT